MSTATIATILLLGVFLVLVFLRVPVVYAIGVASPQAAIWQPV